LGVLQSTLIFHPHPPLPITIHGHPTAVVAKPSLFPLFSSLSIKKPILPIFLFFFIPIFLLFKGTIRVYGLCLVFLCWILFYFAGVGKNLKDVLKPLILEVHSRCWTKVLNQLSSCLEYKLPLLGPLEPRPQ
jgi:hypothetical protein